MADNPFAVRRLELTDATGHPVRVEVDRDQLAIEFRSPMSGQPAIYRLVVPIDAGERAELVAALA